MNVSKVCARWIGWLVLGWMACCGVVRAGDPSLRLELVWGTNEAKPPEKEFKELDEAGRKKLSALKWKNYFVVKGTNVVAPKDEFRRIELSSRCAVEVRRVGAQLEVRIFQLEKGKEPKLVDTKRHDFGKIGGGEVFSYGANSKDNADDAWLILIRAAPTPP